MKKAKARLGSDVSGITASGQLLSRTQGIPWPRLLRTQLDHIRLHLHLAGLHDYAM